MAVNDIKPAAGKLAYALLFMVAIPALLIGWSIATAKVVPLPDFPFRWVGPIVLVTGLFFMAGGAGALWFHGGGLPMSPYPPPVYVSKGLYRLTAHPIYLGFVLVCFGLSIFLQSPSGLWLVSPAMALACAALVLGFERQEIRDRLGDNVVIKPLIALPAHSDGTPSGWDRISLILLVFLPWAILFEAVYLLGIPPDAVEAYLPFERGWPVWEWSEAIYASTYLFVLSALFVCPAKADLRRFAILGLIATALVTFIYITVPLIAPPRPFTPQTILGHLLMFERGLSNTVGAFPAFHLIWSLIAADAWTRRSWRFGVAGFTWAAFIGISCLTTGMHALADLISAVILYLFVRNYMHIWKFLLLLAERVANSWSEWRMGNLRLINHCLYAGLGAFAGLFISSGFAGPEAFGQLAIIHIAALLGAGLWAQSLEGSPKLSRPYGYYGSVLGIIVATVIVGALKNNTMVLAASLALAAPWVQAIGRLRCLVQGCCHGSETCEHLGIRYWRKRSRVCTLGDLRGVPLHPTPLYSILANAVIGLLLLRLWSVGAAYSLIAGNYLILAGVARFVEESYRGEPQTIIWRGLRIYQWLAILSFVLGAILTTIPADAAPGISFWLDTRAVMGAAAYGLLVAFAMGVDFPRSRKRFARLAPP